MMSAVGIIASKRSGRSLDSGAWREFAVGAADGSWSDSQLAAMLMAIALVGMDVEETGWLVEAMAGTGSRISPQRFDRPAVDKHSTGGVGDKASLVVAPLAAACGLDVPMISGRGLGHTGGTLDKLESIPGFRVELSIDELVAVVADAGCAICGASREIAPADRVLYALRDATATVDSIPLICGSILSKKLAEGIIGLVLDVKCGSGAVFSEDRESERLARTLVSSGLAAGLPTVAVLSDMTSPLGRTVGTANELSEAIDCLTGEGPGDLRALSLELVSRMLVSGDVCDSASAGWESAVRALDAGAAYERLERMVVAQGGDASVLTDRHRLVGESEQLVVRASVGGWVGCLDALTIGCVAAELGASRSSAGTVVDGSAGVRIVSRVGCEVSAGDAVLELRSADRGRLERAESLAISAIEIVDAPGVLRELVLGRIDASNVDESNLDPSELDEPNR
jgi:pyrimidine-nucleoside phosphorylase